MAQINATTMTIMRSKILDHLIERMTNMFDDVDSDGS